MFPQRQEKEVKPEVNPAVPSLFDAPTGTRNFRGSGERAKAPPAAAWDKPKEEPAVRPLPESPNSKKVPKKLNLPGVSTAQPPTLFSDSAKWWDKAHSEGV